MNKILINMNSIEQKKFLKFISFFMITVWFVCIFATLISQTKYNPKINIFLFGGTLSLCYISFSSIKELISLGIYFIIILINYILVVEFHIESYFEYFSIGISSTLIAYCYWFKTKKIVPQKDDKHNIIHYD